MRAMIIFSLALILVLQTANAFVLEPETWVSFKDVQNVDYTPPSGKVITKIQHYVPAGTEIQGTIYYGSKSLNYKINYTHSFLTSTIYLEIGEKNVTITEYDWLGWDKNIVLTYSYYEDNYEISLIYDDGSIFKKGISISDDSLPQSAIYKVVLTSNNPVTVKIGIISYDAYIGGWEETTKPPEESSIFNIQNLLSFAEGSYCIIANIIYYFNLIFIDNGLLTFALFEAFVLAYSVTTSRNIFAFYRRYINTHKALFEFLIWMIGKIVGIFTSIINALKPL